MTSYNRMTPVKLLQMYELKEKDQSTWQMLDDGSFSVNKSDITFTGIGSDHGIQQENQTLQVLGGTKGVANSNVALSEYFHTAAEMGNIVESFSETFGKQGDKARKKDDHYQFWFQMNI